MPSANIDHTATSIDGLEREIRDHFTQLIDKFSNQHIDDIDWWVSEIASRNPYASPLYSDLVDFLVTNKRSSRNLKNNLKNLIKPFYLYCNIFLTQILSYFLVKIFSISPKISKEPITLIDIFIFAHSFDDNYQYQDRYYGSLLNNLTKTELKSFYYNPTFQITIKQLPKIFKKLKKSNNQFLLKENFLKIQDYIWAFMYPIRSFKFFPKKTFFLGKDITSILRKSWWNTTALSIEGLLKYRFTQRLSERQIPIRLIVDWFENQSIDKGSTFGFKKFYSSTPVIGYQGFIVPDYYSCQFPTTIEQKAKVIPDEIIVCGDGFVESRKKYCPTVNVKSGPAFRFSHIWSPREHFPNDDAYRILVPLHLIYQNGIIVLDLISQASLNTLHGKNIHYVLKPHPGMHNFNKLFQASNISKQIESIEIITGDFTTALEKCHLLIGNTSSTCLESLAKGIPCIIAGSLDHLTHNPLPPGVDEEIWALCKKPSELRTAIANLLKLNKQHLEKTASKIKSKYFEPVTFDNCRKFLKLP